MELILLGLAGLGGLALFLQQKAVPSKEDSEKAFAVLDKDPTDAAANTTFGKYKAFVIGDYEGAMPYLVHSSDITLKTLADHELDASHTATAPMKVGMGDEWVAAAKKIPALSRIFYDRANQWYLMAWPNLDGLWKAKAREQAAKLSASRPTGVARKALPDGWTADTGAGIVTPPTPDGTIARTGSYSIKIPPTSDKVKNIASVIRTGLLPVSGKTIEANAYLRSENTENGADVMFILPFDQAGNQMAPIKAFIANDLPFWHPMTIKADLPPNAARVQFGIGSYSKNGSIWIDDASVKVDGKDLLKNGSFEDR